MFEIPFPPSSSDQNFWWDCQFQGRDRKLLKLTKLTGKSVKLMKLTDFCLFVKKNWFMLILSKYMLNGGVYQDDSILESSTTRGGNFEREFNEIGCCCGDVIWIGSWSQRWLSSELSRSAKYVHRENQRGVILPKWKFPPPLHSNYCEIEISFTNYNP